MLEYVEFPVQLDLADAVECSWTIQQTGKSSVVHRVVPDGCADIIFTRGSGKPVLTAIGSMTRFEDFTLIPGQSPRFSPS